jgi:hypothetical protein
MKNIKHLLNSLGFILILLATSLLTFLSCDDSKDPGMTDEPSISQGVFIDSPVEGISYLSGSQSGKTDATGKFEYEEGKSVIFSVGGISLGESEGNDVVSPLDLIANSTINTQAVRNIAAFLQSLDQDGNPGNGIKISAETVEVLSILNLDFDSDNFLSELTALIEMINTSNETSLFVVNANDAASHLAGSLGVTSEFEILPKVIKGRQWEQGEYWNYNTNATGEYIFRIGSDLNGVKYNFGNNGGFYMNMEYSQNTLSGFGNFYTDLDADPPVTPSPSYDYRNRILSPGYVFDYGGSIYLGYYNYFKKEGEVGKLQGVYHQFFYYDQKRVDQEPTILNVLNSDVIIGDPNDDGDFPASKIDYDSDGNIVAEVEMLIDRNDLDQEDIMLIRFQQTDYIFMDTVVINKYFHPGLISVKK